MAQERENELLSMLSRNGVESLEGKRVLEIGCDMGYWLRAFLQWERSRRMSLGLICCPEGLNRPESFVLRVFTWSAGTPRL